MVVYNILLRFLYLRLQILLPPPPTPPILLPSSPTSPFILQPPPTPPPTPEIPLENNHQCPFNIDPRLTERRIELVEGLFYNDEIFPMEPVYIVPPTIVNLGQGDVKAQKRVLLVTIPEHFIHCPIALEIIPKKGKVGIATEDFFVIDGGIEKRDYNCTQYPVIFSFKYH